MANPDAPTFENTIVALDQSGELLTKVMYAFGGQSSVNTTDEIQELERELYPLLSKHSDDISLNPKLFARVKSVYEREDIHAPTYFRTEYPERDQRFPISDR